MTTDEEEAEAGALGGAGGEDALGGVTKHYGKILAGMILAAVVAVPVMQKQISTLEAGAARLTLRLDSIDSDLNMATRALVLLSGSVNLDPNDVAPMGGGYDRKGALEGLMQKLEPPPAKRGDDDDSAKAGDDDDSGVGAAGDDDSAGDDDDSAGPGQPPVLGQRPVLGRG
jgi:hypothetical protein